MSTTVVRRLPELAAEITNKHELCEGSYRTALGFALEVGELLVEAKAQLAHGEWMPWLAEHTPISYRNATRYMQLANAPNVTAMSDLGIEGALHSVAQPPAAKASGDDLRTALKGVDPDDAKAALDELGPMHHESSFPVSAMERTTWRQISETLARVKRAMDEGSAGGLSKWSRREALHEASRHARNAASQLSELADSLGA